MNDKAMISSHNYSFFFECENGVLKICQDSWEDDMSVFNKVELSVSQIDYFIKTLKQFKKDIING